MKVEQRVKHYVSVFICESCGAEFEKEVQAYACEHRHRVNTCAHRKWNYEAGGFAGSAAFLNRVCEDCGAEQDMDLSDVDSVTLEKVWAVIATARTEGE